MAENLDVPFGRIQQAEQQFDGGGFARTVRPEQAEHFAAPHFEIDIVDCARFGPAPEIFEDFGQAADGDDDFTVAIARLSGRGLRMSWLQSTAFQCLHDLDVNGCEFARRSSAP